MLLLLLLLTMMIMIIIIACLYRAHSICMPRHGAQKCCIMFIMDWSSWNYTDKLSKCFVATSLLSLILKESTYRACFMLRGSGFQGIWTALAKLISQKFQVGMHIITFFSISIPILIPHYDTDIKSIYMADTNTTLLLWGKLFLAGKQRPAIRSTSHHLLLLPTRWWCTVVTTMGTSTELVWAEFPCEMFSFCWNILVFYGW